MLVAITRDVSPNIGECELTFIDRQPIDYQLAASQLENYRASLEKCGVLVRKLPADGRFPDSCFVEDTAIVVDELAVIANMGAASRRGETPVIEAELSIYRNIARITQPATVEGGDVVNIGRHILVGVSTRTNEAGIRQLGRILEEHGYRVSPVRTTGSLHLKSVCTAVDGQTLLVNRAGIQIGDLAGFDLIFTPDEEPAAANVLRVGETLFVQAGFPRTMELLRTIHAKVEALDTSELRKAEGALSCLSIIFNAGTSGHDR